jgi:hypothetical protein
VSRDWANLIKQAVVTWAGFFLRRNGLAYLNSRQIDPSFFAICVCDFKIIYNLRQVLPPNEMAVG